MEFRLLGPVEATVGGHAIDLGPARQRCVLAALLVDVNRVVPVEQLIDRVWGEQRPYRPHSTLYSYLSRLRTALQDDAAVAITHRSGGYLLTADPDTIDLHQFRTLIARARAGAVEEAAALFTQALALWRDEPFATLDTSWLSGMRAVLEAERRAAELERNDLELRLGRHRELLAGLRIEAAAHPLDERLAGQLMLANYLAGRQDEALQVYRDTRTALVEQLGLEPGPELGLLHRRVLAGDPDLAAPGGGPAAVSSPVPRQLPLDVVHFTGRERYLADLRAMCTEAAMVITAIDGSAGVGKTALAIHFGHEVAGHYPDGQLYLDLRGYSATSPMTPTEALGALLRGLGLRPERIPAEEAEQAALYRSALAGKRVLVVLDNARSAAQVRPLLPASSGCLVVATSRTTLAALDGVGHLHLDVLTDQEATALLSRLAGDRRVAHEPEAATTLVSLCARLPLAVRIAGARLAARPNWTVAALVDRLTDEQRRLDELQLDDRAVRASFAVTYHALKTSPDAVDKRAARLFCLLGVLDWVTMSIPVAAALLDAPQPEAQDTLERLVDAHLLDSAGPGRYHTHDLLRLYAREQDLPSEARSAALYRALDCYVAASEQAALLLTSDPRSVAGGPAPNPHGGFALATPKDVAGWVDTMHASLLVAASQALAIPDAAAVAARLVTGFTRPFEARGHWRDLITLLERVGETANRLGDRANAALATEDLGFVYLRVGRTNEAITMIKEALARWREIEDRRGESACLKYLGYAYHDQQRIADAMVCYEESLVICREIGYRYGEAGAMNALGLCLQRNGNFVAALDHHRRALAIHHEIGNRLGEPSALNNLGWAYHRSGDQQRAVECLEQALTMAGDIGFRYQEAETMWGLGQTQHALGRLDQARTYWHHAIATLHDIGLLTSEEAGVLGSQPIPDTPEIIQRNT